MVDDAIKKFQDSLIELKFGMEINVSNNNGGDGGEGVTSSKILK